MSGSRETLRLSKDRSNLATHFKARGSIEFRGRANDGGPGGHFASRRSAAPRRLMTMWSRIRGCESLLGSAVVISLLVFPGVNAASTFFALHDPKFLIAFVIVWLSTAARQIMPRARCESLPTCVVRPNARLLLRNLFGILPWLLMSSTYAARPQWFASTPVVLPEWLRWVGLGAGASSILAPCCEKTALSGNVMRVQGGLAVVSLFLLSANWLVALFGAVGLVLVLSRQIETATGEIVKPVRDLADTAGGSLDLEDAAAMKVG